VSQGGNRRSREARVKALERERNVVQLYIRGLTWIEIARQLGLETEGGARHVFDRAVGRMPPGDIELMRKMEGERITDLRRRIWSELAGRPDPADPTKTIRPDPGQVMEMIGTAVKVGRHEAMIFGLDAPTKSDIAAVFQGAQPITDEEAALRWARLTEEEQDTWMRLKAKMEGRWIEPSIETVALPPPDKQN
jgi:hypothetical protein